MTAQSQQGEDDHQMKEAFGAAAEVKQLHQQLRVPDQGHRTTVYLILMTGGNAIGGSSWDFCNRCSEGPATPI